MKALLFDFDGTLLNTNTLIIETFRHVFETHAPGQYTDEHYLSFIGPSLLETFTAHMPGRAEEMVAHYREWNAIHHDELVEEYPFVTETLRELHERGMRLAIVTTKQRATLERGLALMGIRELFEVVVTLDDVTHVKPHPEPIEKALALLNVAKEDVIMIGDNSHDIHAGQNAGVKTAGVAWSIKGEAYIRSLQPDYVLQSMRDVLQFVKG